MQARHLVTIRIADPFVGRFGEFGRHERWAVDVFRRQDLRGFAVLERIEGTGENARCGFLGALGFVERRDVKPAEVEWPAPSDEFEVGAVVARWNAILVEVANIGAFAFSSTMGSSRR